MKLDLDIVTARQLLTSRPGEHERAGWAVAWGLALLDEVSRLRIELDRAERGFAYYQQRAADGDAESYRTLVERTAECNALRARLREVAR